MSRFANTGIAKTPEQIKRNVELKKMESLHWTNVEIVNNKILKMRKSGLKINAGDRISTHNELMKQICHCAECNI